MHAPFKALVLVLLAGTRLAQASAHTAADVEEMAAQETWDYLDMSAPGMSHSPYPKDAENVWTAFIDETFDTLRSLPLPTYLASPQAEEPAFFAMIVEPRGGDAVIRRLEYAVRNVMHFLPDGWGLQVFCSAGNEAAVRASLADLHNVVYTDVASVSYLGPSWDFTKNSAWYQYFFLSQDLWATHVKGSKVLVFQPDVLLLRRGLDAFLDYDYVGAPWTRGSLSTATNSDGGICGNGGLSLRSVSAMRRCTAVNSFAYKRLHSRIAARRYCTNEDMVFAWCLLGDKEVRLPTHDVAMSFSVETLFFETPLGFHAPWRHLTPEQVQTMISQVTYDVRSRDEL